MIGCGIGAIGAKSMGNLLERNASLKELVLDGEHLLNSHSSPGVIYSALLWHVFIHRES
jgi:hypothetical protein